MQEFRRILTGAATAQVRVRTGGVVVDPPRLDHVTCSRQRLEPVEVQALVADPRVATGRPAAVGMRLAFPLSGYTTPSGVSIPPPKTEQS
jgi:hypothetical protein